MLVDDSEKRNAPTLKPLRSFDSGSKSSVVSNCVGMDAIPVRTGVRSFDLPILMKFALTPRRKLF